VTVVIGDRDQVEHEPALRNTFARFLPQATFRVLKGIVHLSPQQIRLARCRGRGEAALLQLKNVRLRTAKFLKSDGRRLSLSGHPGSGACKQVHRAPAKPNNFDMRRNRDEVLQRLEQSAG
jgi:hypothetical protein